MDIDDKCLDYSHLQNDPLNLQYASELSGTRLFGASQTSEKIHLEPILLDEALGAANGNYRIERGEAIQVHNAQLPQFVEKAIPDYEVAIPAQNGLNPVNFKKVYRHVVTDPLYKNSIFTMASTLILGGLGFIFWILVARLYKTEMVGISTTLISTMTLLSSFTIMGFNSSLMRYLPKSTNKNSLINTSFVIVTLVSILTSFIFLFGLNVFSPQLVFLKLKPFYLISFTIFVIFCSWNTLVESAFIAYRAASNILIKNSVISILKLVLPFALIAFGAYGIFTSTALAVALGVFIALLILGLKFKFKPSISVDIALIKETSTYSFANYMTSFMFNMPSLVMPLIILNVLSAEYAAYYYIASMIQNILQIIPLATAQVLLTEGSYNEAELKQHVKKALVTIFAFLIPGVAAIVFWGRILLQFFGKSYASEAFQFLQLYSASTIFTALILVVNAILNVKRRVRSLVILNVITSVLTLGLACTFISDKLIGIGWGWTLGQAISGLISLLFVANDSFVTSLRRRSLRSRITMIRYFKDLCCPRVKVSQDIETQFGPSSSPRWPVDVRNGKQITKN